jgi:phage repressor protein C with HTH and peptisase S24 domain
MSFGADDDGPDYLAAVPDNADIGKRIRELREGLPGKVSQYDFAKRLGKTTRGAVGNWERGLGIKRENLLAIADTFGISVEWLATGSGPQESSKGPSASETPNAFVRDKVTKKGALIPLYGHAVGGVDGEFVLNGNKLDEILAPPDLSPVNGAYAVTCAGESMEPRFFDGETVFVAPGHRVRRGDFVVAQIKNPHEGSAPLAYIKRFVRRNDAELILEQYNPVKELRFAGEDVVSVHFIAAQEWL